MARGTLLLATLCAASPALGNPFSAARYRGLMGTAVDASGFSVYWNPAALGTLEGVHLSLHAGGVHRDASFDRAVEANGETPETAPYNSGEGTTEAWGVVPSIAGSYTLSLGEDFGLGLGAGFYIARAGLANWNRHPEASAAEPGAFDGPQRWGTISTRLIVATPTLAVGLTHKPTGLSLGVAPAFNLVSLSLNRARNPDQSTTLRDVEGRIAEGRILLEDGEAFAVTWVVGARWDVDRDLAFAVTWHQGADYQVEGKSFIQFGTADETTANARFPLQVADSIRLAAKIGVTDWMTLRSEVEWAGWSRMDKQEAVNLDDPDRPVLMRIERAFEDTLAARLRTDFRVAEAVVIHGGLEYETGATPPQTHEPGLAESDSVQIGVGGSFQLSEHLALTTSFIVHEFVDVEVTNSIQGPPQNGLYTDHRQYLTVDLEVTL